jgi:hypothetical protein
MQWLPALVFSIFFLAGLARAEEIPPVSEIIGKVLARDEADHAALAHYQYRQKVVTERLNSDGSLRHAETLEMIVHPGENSDFTIVADGKGSVLTPTDPERKQARDSEKLKANFSLRELATRFDVRVGDKETLDGRPVYLLFFSPRPGEPFNNRIEKILNNLGGKMWVDAEDYSILKTQAYLATPVAMAWVFATMKSLDFLYRSEPVGNGASLRGPAEFDIDFRVGVMMGEIRQRQRISMDAYQAR